MKILAPFYCYDFECIGSKCPDTCCIGWGILVDQNTFNKYQNVTGDFGDKLVNSIKGKDTLFFKLDEGQRCHFLDENNLCEIVIRLGEEYLCETCQAYPRIIYQFEEILEYNLALSCPEVARILLSIEQPIDFIYKEIEGNTGKNKYIAYDLYDYFLKTRKISIDIVQNRQLSLWKRMVIIAVMHNKIQGIKNNIERESIINLYKNVDSIKNFSNSLDSVTDYPSEKINLLFFLIDSFKFHSMLEYRSIISGYRKDMNETEIMEFICGAEKEFEVEFRDKVYQYENFIVYYLFRYYMQSIKDNNIYKFVVMMCLEYALIKFFSIFKWLDNGKNLTLEEQCIIYSKFSRDLEHNTERTNKIYEHLKEIQMDSVAYITLLVKGDF